MTFAAPGAGVAWIRGQDMKIYTIGGGNGIGIGKSSFTGVLKGRTTDIGII